MTGQGTQGWSSRAGVHLGGVELGEQRSKVRDCEGFFAGIMNQQGPWSGTQSYREGTGGWQNVAWRRGLSLAGLGKAEGERTVLWAWVTEEAGAPQWPAWNKDTGAWEGT